MRVGAWVATSVAVLAGLATVGSFVYPTFIKSSSTAAEPREGGCSAYHLPTPDRLVFCDKGPRVTELQENLAFLGYDVKPDSYFGIETRTAVRAFEQVNALPVNGQVNAETTDAIRSLVRDRGGQPTIPTDPQVPSETS